MSTLVEKQIRLDDEQARRLEQLAGASGRTESSIVGEALDLLFSESAVGKLPPKLFPEDVQSAILVPLRPELMVASEVDP